jgi:hypothetical protein
MGRLLISTPLGHLLDLLDPLTRTTICTPVDVVALAGAGTLSVVDYCPESFAKSSADGGNSNSGGTFPGGFSI